MVVDGGYDEIKLLIDCWQHLVVMFCWRCASWLQSKVVHWLIVTWCTLVVTGRLCDTVTQLLIGRQTVLPSMCPNIPVRRCSGLVVEYRTRNQDVAGSTHTQSFASNLEQVDHLLCAQANSASYPQRDRKWVVATATGWRPTVAVWGNDGVSPTCTVGPTVR